MRQVKPTSFNRTRHRTQFLTNISVKFKFNTMIRNALLDKYDHLKANSLKHAYSPEMTALFGELYSGCLNFLNSLNRQDLISKVDGKTYFAFKNGNKLSRAINADLYKPSFEEWNSLTNAMANNDISAFNPISINKILYSVAISFCACVDLIKDGDQKTPGTFFECFIAYLFTWRVGIEPKKSIQILSIDNEDTKLPTDLIFNLGPHLRKFHVPVKTSTRERSIMLWAHQKLIDGVYGIGRFTGTPVLLAETKVDKVKKEVVEICLPDQWRVYQLYIAKLTRIYYFDVPTSYAKLNNDFPPLVVKPFSDFFFEWSTISPT